MIENSFIPNVLLTKRNKLDRLCFFSSLAIILMGKREQVALLCLSYWCLVIVVILWLFLTVLWDGLPCVIVVFSDHTH